MKLNRSNIICLALIGASLGVSAYVYPLMPEYVVSHWDAAGSPNGYMPRFWGVFLLPIIMIAAYLLLTFIPSIDPESENIEKFRSYYEWFIAVTMGFFLYLHILVLLWNLGFLFSFTQLLIPAFSLLIYSAGLMMRHTRHNWTIGIRTPWTLSSESVWNRTHKVGAVLFEISAVVSLLGIFFPPAAMWLLIGPVVTAGILSVIYSYVLYRREKKNS